jgi:hypothetical protein
MRLRAVDFGERGLSAVVDHEAISGYASTLFDR